jgi:PAS domain S-box-containing protein
MNFITGENIFSERFREIFGFNNPDVSVHQVAGAIHPDDLHISDAANQSILEGGFINYDIRIIISEDNIRWINTVGKLFMDENMNPARFVGVIRDITSEKQAEQRMAMLAGIVQSSADAIISKKLDGTITSWNEAAERIYGYSASEVQGKNISIIVPPELWEQEERIIERLKAGETVTHFETRRVTKNKKLLDISLTISPVKDFRGNVIGASKISRDITAQKKVERHIFENEERLQMVIGAADLGTWEIMLPSDEMKISDKVLQMLGYNPGETLTRKKIIEHVHPDDKELRNRIFEQAFRTGSLDAEFRMIRKDGSICWINLQGKVIFDYDNKPVKMMGTIRDITNKIAAVEELRESEQKFRLLADAMPQLIWTSDELGRSDYFNNSFTQYSGLSLTEVEKSGWLQLVHPEDREESVRRWSESVKKGADFIFEHRFRRYDGEYRWHLTRALPQKNSAGQIQMWVGTSTDIHEQKTFSKELELKVAERTRDLQEANMGLEKMNQELASFAYVSSHDLQEPLRKIQIFAMHILEKEEKNLTETGRDYFGRMQKAANRMQNLIEDLLVYSRTNTKEKIFELTDLNIILNEVKGELDQMIHEKKAVLEHDRLPSLHIIPYQFRQLFTNLISNSLKFSKKTEAPLIRITVKKIKGRDIGIRTQNEFYCHIQLKDNGIGFLPEYNEKIFEVFQRLHGRSEYEGTGIGLAIAKKIVENHSGFINAEGEQGKGAVFNIYIPFT